MIPTIKRFKNLNSGRQTHGRPALIGPSLNLESEDLMTIMQAVMHHMRWDRHLIIDQVPTPISDRNATRCGILSGHRMRYLVANPYTLRHVADTMWPELKISEVIDGTRLKYTQDEWTRCPREFCAPFLHDYVLQFFGAHGTMIGNAKNNLEEKVIRAGKVSSAFYAGNTGLEHSLV